MFNAAPIRFHYLQIADLFFFQAVLFHFVLGVTVWLVFSGNKKPGQQMVSALFASMAFSVSYALGGRDLPLFTVAFVVLGFCAVWDTVFPLTAWGGGSKRPVWGRRLAWVGLGLAWVYPHHIALWKAPIGAPLGTLPSPTLLALLSLLWLAWPQTHRLLHWAAAILGLLFGLHGVLVLHVPTDALLLVLAAMSLRDLIRSVHEAGGILEEDLTPEERKPHPASKRTKAEQVYKI